MVNASILNAFERMWQHIAATLADKSDVGHNHTISDIANDIATVSEVKTYLGI